MLRCLNETTYSAVILHSIFLYYALPDNGQFLNCYWKCDDDDDDAGEYHSSDKILGDSMTSRNNILHCHFVVYGFVNLGYYYAQNIFY